MNLDFSTQSLGVLSFGTTALVCFLAWRRVGGVWGGLTVIYIMLSVEVLLLARLRVSTLLRDVLRSSVFYDQRAGLPAIIILSLLFCSLLLGGWWIARQEADWPGRLALLVCCCTIFLFVLEVTSLHSLDVLFYRPAGPVFLIGWFWAGFSALAGAAALWARRKTVT